MDIFDIAVAKALSGEGGGGSSDFTTATVTVAGNGIEASFAFAMDSPEFTGLVSAGYQTLTVGSYKVPLYKGYMVCEIAPSLVGGTITVSGNIQDIGEGAYFITGDCTITSS